MRASRIRIRGQKRINRLLGQKSTGAAKIVEKIRIARSLLQCRLQVDDCVGELPGLRLRNPERGLLVSTLEMGNRLGRITLREQRIPKQLVRRHQIWVKLERVLERFHSS